MKAIDVRTLSGGEIEQRSALPYSILPVGSVEYHGEFGPFGTDLTLADELARRLSTVRPCLLFPPIAYSFVPRLTRQFGPGVSVEPETFQAYVREVMGSLLDFGPKRLLVLNGHSENQYSLRLAAESLFADRPDVSVAIVNWWKFAPTEAAQRSWGETGGHGHGGPLELSVTAALDPDGVALPENSRHDIDYEAPWWRGGAMVVGRGQEPLGFRGYHGKVSQIDPAKGEEIATQVIAELARFVDDWLDRADTQT